MPQAPGASSSHNVAPLLVTVHGIRTFGQWQERLGEIIQAEGNDTRAFHYKYGYFSIMAFVIPFLRWMVTRRFRRALLALIENNAGTPIDIVAHSFGTHIVGWALWELRKHPACRIRTVILAGSVLKSNFPWNTLLDQCTVDRVINECGIHDDVLLLNQVAVLFTGMAGRIGFNGFLDQRFMNNFHAFGHSDYFLCDGVPSNTFMISRWVPLLTQGRIPSTVDMRSPSAFSGFFTFIAQNAEPLKVACYSSPFIVLTVIFFLLYANSEEQRRLSSARAKAAEAQTLFTSNELQLGDAAQLAVEAAFELRETQLGAFRRKFAGILGDRLTAQSAPSSNIPFVLRSTVALLPLNKMSEAFPANKDLEEVSPSVEAAVHHGQQSVQLTFSDTAQTDEESSVEESSANAYVLDLKTGHLSPSSKVSLDTTSGKDDGANATSVDGNYVAAVRGNMIEIVRLSDRRIKRTQARVEQAVDLLFSPHNSYLAWRTEPKLGEVNEGHLCIWKFHSRALPGCSSQHDTVNALAFSPDESMLAAALGASPEGSGGYKESTADAAELLSTDSVEVLQTLKHRARVTGVSFSPRGGRVATLSEDRTVKVWSTESGRELRRIVGEGEFISADFLADGRLLTISEHGVRLDDVAGEALGELGNPLLSSIRFAFNHAGTQLAIAYPDELQVWRVRPLRLENTIAYPMTKDERKQLNLERFLRSLPPIKRPKMSSELEDDLDKDLDEELLDSSSIGFSRDDACIIVDRAKRKSQREQLAWSAATFAPVGHCEVSRIPSLEQSAGGFRVAATDLHYKTVRTISVNPTGSDEEIFATRLNSYVEGDDKLRGGGFGLSPNGKVFASVVDDHLKVIVRNLVNGSERTFVSPRQFVALTFSPDSRYLALGEVEGTVNILDVQSMREVDRLADPEGVTALLFDNLGSRLAVAHQKLFTLYELNLQTAADQACAGRVRCPSH
jgi:WD40 repeat protein/pimeloyl-ACP methyl ester carboxylesterase